MYTGGLWTVSDLNGFDVRSLNLRRQESDSYLVGVYCDLSQLVPGSTGSAAQPPVSGDLAPSALGS